MESDFLSRCLDGEMVDTRDSKSRAKERGGSSPLQGKHNVDYFCLYYGMEWAQIRIFSQVKAENFLFLSKRKKVLPRFSIYDTI